MKKSLIVLFVFIVLCSCKALLPKKILPYSMVQYQPNHFVDDSEITVEQYAEFLTDGNQKHRPDSSISKAFSYHSLFYPKQTPDSLYKAFGKVNYYQLPVVKAHFDTLNYAELRQILDMPISGVTYENAIAYTKWRTKKYNQERTSHTKKGIQFSLPDSVVFTKMNTIYTSNQYGRRKPLYNIKGASYEVKRDAPNKKQFEAIGKLPVPVKKFEHNGYKVYDLVGNVAEMTRQKGVAYGGSYQTDEHNLQHIQYKQPEAWLGFRCIGVVTD